MRGLSANLIFTPSVTYLDSKYVLFEDAETFLIILSSAWSIAFIVTLILAINHFRKVRTLTK